MKNLNGFFTSVWDGNTEITTPAKLNVKTGEITTESVETNDIDILEREYFTLKSGDELEVCPECHEYILKTVMKESDGKSLYEAKICSNPNCENQ